MTDPDRLLVGAPRIEDEPVHGREEGQTPVSWPVPDQIKRQTRSSHRLAPVVLLFPLVGSCSPSQAFASPSYCTSPSPGCSHWLGAPSFGRNLWHHPYFPSPRKVAEHISLSLLPVWDCPSVLLILRASPLAVSQSQYSSPPWRS